MCALTSDAHGLLPLCKIQVHAAVELVRDIHFFQADQLSEIVICQLGNVISLQSEESDFGPDGGGNGRDRLEVHTVTLYQAEILGAVASETESTTVLLSRGDDHQGGGNDEENVGRHSVRSGCQKSCLLV